MSIIQRIRIEFGFIKGNILVLMVGSLFIYFADWLARPFEQLYIRELGASPSTIGLVTSLGSLIFTIIRIPGGYIADKYGRRSIMVAMSYGVALSYVFYAIAPSWHYIVLGITILNITTIQGPAFLAMQADSLPPEKRGLGYSLSSVLPNAPAIFAPTISGFLVERLGLVSGMRIVYLVVIICHVSTSVLRTLFLKETLTKTEKFKVSNIGEAFRKSIYSMYKISRSMSYEIKLVVLLAFIMNFSTPFFSLFQSLYVNDVIGIKGVEWGIVGTITLIVTIVAGYPIGKIIDKIGRIKSILIAYLIWFPAMFAFFFIKDLFSLIVITSTFSISGALFMPAFFALRADLIPRENRGQVNALIGLVMSLASIPSSAIAGYLYQWNPAYPFVTSLIIDFLTFLVILIFIKEPEIREF